MTSLEDLIIQEKYDKVIEKFQIISGGYEILHFIELTLYKKKTPELKAFLNTIRQQFSKKLCYTVIKYIFYCDFFFIENLFDVTNFATAKNLARSCLRERTPYYFRKILKYIGLNQPLEFYKNFISNETDFYRNNTSFYDDFNDPAFLPVILDIFIKHIENIFDFNEVQICVKSMNLCNLVAKKRLYNFIKYINRYLTEYDWMECDSTSGYIPILDAAKYSSYPMFVFIYNNMDTNYLDYTNDENLNVLNMALMNSDTRILKFILQNHPEISIGHDSLNFSLNFGSKLKICKKLKMILNYKPYYLNKRSYELLQLRAGNFITIANFYKERLILNTNYINPNESYKLKVNESIIKNEEARNIVLDKLPNNELLAIKFYYCLHFNNPIFNRFDICKFNNKIDIIKGILSFAKMKSLEHIKESFEFVVKIIKKYKIQDPEYKIFYDSAYYFNDILDLFYRNGLFYLIPKEVLENKPSVSFSYYDSRGRTISLKWNKTLNLMNSVIESKKKREKNKHCMFFNRSLRIINNKNRGQRLVPQHIEAKDVVRLIHMKQLYISPKADGTLSELDIYEMIPRIKVNQFTDTFRCELVVINDIPVNFIIADFQTIELLKRYHPYFPEESSVWFHDIVNLDEGELQVEKEALMEYIEINKHKNGLWWPKSVYKMNTFDIHYNLLLDNSFYNVFPTDGWVIYTDEQIYKIKPKEHMTIDLLYKNNTFMSREGFLIDYKIDNMEDIKDNKIYRIKKVDEKWIIDSLREDKKLANPIKIVDMIIKQIRVPIDFKTIINVFKQKKLYYQVLGNTSGKSKKDDILCKFSRQNNIIDIGCGFKMRFNAKLMKANSYVGIDIDPKINDNNLVFLNIKHNWKYQLDLLNNNEMIRWGSYDNIVMINSIHNIYSNEEENIKNINRLANRGCIMIIKYLDWEMLRKINKNTIINNSNFVRIIDPLQTITYYYSNIHNKPITEHVYTTKDLKTMFSNWNVIFEEKKELKNNLPTWENYENCFKYICLQF